jgi:hypothetical protein
MSPTTRYFGTLDRVRAVLNHGAIYEIGAALDQPRDLGHPPVHPPYVLLVFAALARAARSTVRVETDLLEPENWEHMKRGMAATVARLGLDVPPPGRIPPAWHHWRRFRDDHLVTDEGLATLARLHLPAAARLAQDIGLLRSNRPGSFTHPSRERAIYGDGTIVRPIYNPPRAIRVPNADGTATVPMYLDSESGELSETPFKRFDPDIAEHHGHQGPVSGHGYVAFHARGRGTYERVTLSISHIPAPGQESATALSSLADIYRHLKGAVETVVYDGAIRGAHIDHIMSNYGYLVIAKQPELDATTDPVPASLVLTSDGKRYPNYPIGTVTHDGTNGACAHHLIAINGRPADVGLDESGDPVVLALLERGPIKRARRKNGKYHFNAAWDVPCANGDFTTWLSPHAKKEGDPRPEILRLLPDGDPDFLNIRGIRSDAESTHSQFKRTLITERAMSVGWRRGLIDYYAFAWYSNALTEWQATQASVRSAAQALTRAGRLSRGVGIQK